MKDFLSLAERKIEEAKKAVAELEEAVDETKRFLDICREEGIRIVSIGKQTEKIKAAKDWPFSPNGSVFADKRTKDGEPAIWRVAERAGIKRGCGNGGQHQVREEAKLIEGVYKFKKGKWYLLEEE